MQAKKLGCPPPYWFVGYSLGGQLALWGVKAGGDHPDIAGGAVICPSLDSVRSLSYLTSHPIGKYLEKAITQTLKELAWDLYQHHPQDFDPEAIKRADSIWNFDKELVIERLGFSTVEEYYQASSALAILPELKKPTFILYAKDDPMFDPSIISDLEIACQNNKNLTGMITEFGGHVGYFSSNYCQKLWQDDDPWWAWNRALDFIKETSNIKATISLSN
jgi:predicted alpha/beta-fold hydrolase